MTLRNQDVGTCGIALEAGMRDTWVGLRGINGLVGVNKKHLEARVTNMYFKNTQQIESWIGFLNRIFFHSIWRIHENLGTQLAMSGWCE